VFGIEVDHYRRGTGPDHPDRVIRTPVLEYHPVRVIPGALRDSTMPIVFHAGMIRT
jgi:hypothetical protein